MLEEKVDVYWDVEGCKKRKFMVKYKEVSGGHVEFTHYATVQQVARGRSPTNHSLLTLSLSLPPSSLPSHIPSLHSPFCLSFNYLWVNIIVVQGLIYNSQINISKHVWKTMSYPKVFRQFCWLKTHILPFQGLLNLEKCLVSL